MWMCASARACTCRAPVDRAAKAARLAADSGPFELITARRLLESECAALAAKNASPAQIRRMRAALTAMIRDRKRNVMPLENDRRFHLEMAEASGNSALALLVRTLWDQRTGPLFLQLEHHFDTPDLWDAAIAEHQSVMVAIEAHDGAKARTTMRRHMDQAARRFQKSWTAAGRRRKTRVRKTTRSRQWRSLNHRAARARACADRERRVRRSRRADRHWHLPLRGLDCVRLLLGALVRDLSAVLHALRDERLGILDRGDRALPADLHNVHRRGDRRAQEQSHPGRFLVSHLADATDARDVDRWSMSRGSLSSATRRG